METGRRASFGTTWLGRQQRRHRSWTSRISCGIYTDFCAQKMFPKIYIKYWNISNPRLQLNVCTTLANFQPKCKVIIRNKIELVFPAISSRTNPLYETANSSNLKNEHFNLQTNYVPFLKTPRMQYFLPEYVLFK